MGARPWARHGVIHRDITSDKQASGDTAIVGRPASTRASSPRHTRADV
jgi:hypothetical protein